MEDSVMAAFWDIWDMDASGTDGGEGTVTPHANIGYVMHGLNYKPHDNMRHYHAAWDGPYSHTPIHNVYTLHGFSHSYTYS